MIQVIPIPYSKDNYAFLILSEIPGGKEKFSVLVDAGDADVINRQLKNYADYPCRAVLITHFDRDHAEGLQDIQVNAGYPPVYGHYRHTETLLTHIPMTYGTGTYAPIPLIFPITYVPLKEGQVFNISGLQFQTYECLSHRADHVAYRTGNLLFCGDILFSGGCGRFFHGTARDFLKFAEHLLKMDEDTLIYFAHEYTEINLRFSLSAEPENAVTFEYLNSIRKKGVNLCTVPVRLGLEKQINPFLRFREKSVRAYVKNQFPEEVGGYPDDAAVIHHLRILRNTFT